ncbi:MAG: DUF763 domain-containing protein [Candidatus Brockarchaeota archaeon]|nr:DUF763 domain-containing protein [Candidatus Brockarchaeota archaeon]
MSVSGTFDLRLHGGKAPPWLVSRMLKLAEGIFQVIYLEFGEIEILRRLSDPIWFQAVSNVLGYDWDSSGSTTVTSAVLKHVFNKNDLGIRAAGGKGKRSRSTLNEIDQLCEKNYDADPKELKYASRLVAKVDTSAIQAGYNIYHHMFFFTRSGKWAVIQQGMNIDLKSARRYHWFSGNVKSFVVEPHSGVIGDRVVSNVMNMVAYESEEARKVSVEIASEPISNLRKYLSLIEDSKQTTLTSFIDHSFKSIKHCKIVLEKNINWDALKVAYETKPSNFEQLLAIQGIGPATVKALALVSEIIFDAEVSKRDPIRYSFAFGGKDGVPYPVDRKKMDEAIDLLKFAIEHAKIGDKNKIVAKAT